VEGVEAEGGAAAEEDEEEADVKEHAWESNITYNVW
jgi:hypothetical protein